MNKQSFHRTGLIVLFVLYQFIVTGQSGTINGGMPTIIPPSANMSAMARFIEQPIDKYSGIPKITIPLYTVQEKDISIPIAVSYHAGGRRVEESASWVGLGWSLSAGGAITRSVRGLPDDLYATNANVTGEPNVCAYYTNVGFLYCGNDINRMYNVPFETSDSTWYLNYLREIGMGAKDGIADQFYFSFGNYSGEFLFDKDGNINIIPQQDLKIAMTRQNGHEIIGFTVVTPEGLQYNFSAIERSTITSAGYTYPVEVSVGTESMTEKLNITGPFFGLNPEDTTIGYYATCNSPITRQSYNSAWHLTSITSLVTTAKVDFVYRRENSHDMAYTGENLFWWDTLNNRSAFLTKSAMSNFTRGQMIDSIKWSSGNAVFHIDPTKPRKDVDSRYGNSYALDRIEVRNRYGKLVKKNRFVYSYFVSDDDPEFRADYLSESAREKLDTAYQYRLKLWEITEQGSNVNYFFVYNSPNLPHRASSKQDYWGYYAPSATGDTVGNTGNKFPIIYEYPNETVNGTSYFTSKFSPYPRTSYTGSQYTHSKFAINRAADSTGARGWNLTAIHYPTGAVVDYIYQLNEFYVNNQKIVGGGIRVREVWNTSPDLSTITKRYDYHSSGKIVDLPQFASYHPKGKNGVMLNSSWTGGVGLTKGSFVGYTQVSEVTGLGRTTDIFLAPAMFGTVEVELFKRPAIWKKYLTYQPVNIEGGNCTLWFNANTSDYEFYPRPIAPNYDWKRGLPSETIIYDNQGAVVSRTKRFYTVKSHVKVPNMQVDIIQTDMWASELGQNDCFGGLHSYNYAKSYAISPWLVADSTTTITYYNGDSLITTAKNFYESSVHRQLTGTRTFNRQGSTLKSRNKYATDFPGTAIYDRMSAKNLLAYVIEKIDSNISYNKQLARTKNNFQLWLPDSLIMPASIEKSIAGNSLVTDQTYNNYDKGNLLQHTPKSGVVESYIWGYNKSAVIAHAINAKHNEIFFDSFEEGTGWDNVLTSYDTMNVHNGKYSGKLTNPVSAQQMCHSTKWLDISLSQPTKFKYSAWVYSSGPEYSLYLFMKTATETGYYTYVDQITQNAAGKWVYIEKEFLVPSNITKLNIRIDNNQVGTVWFDDIRLHPSNAKMTSYTCDPLIGITSESDVNSRPIYYEYDDFNRLTLVRDQGGKIIKKICYNYTGQAESCAFNATPNWQRSGSIRCKPCPANGSYFTNEQEHEEVDLNPNSPTGNTSRWVSDGVSGNCVPQPNWQNTTTPLRCKTVNGVNTSELEQQQQDMNPCTAQGTRWVVVSQNCATCPKPAAWVPTGTPTRCETNANGNTGYTEEEYINTEPCSPNYNAITWLRKAYNATLCPPACNTTNCTGNDKKCVNGVCETGTLICVSSVSLSKGSWRCTWRYCFSDGTLSTYSTNTTSSTQCTVQSCH